MKNFNEKLPSTFSLSKLSSSGNSDSSYLKYLTYVNSIPILTREEEDFLVRDYYDNGNTASVNKLILAHLRFVVKIAKRFSFSGISAMELISEGNYGLIKAIQKFDYKKGFRFSTYAFWWIRSSMQEYIAMSCSVVKLGSDFIKNKFSSSKLREVNQNIYTSDVSLESLNDTLSDEESGDFIGQMEKNEDISKLHKAFCKLNEREKKIIKARYIDEKKKTLDDLSKEYLISKERIRQIQSGALKKLKENF